MKIRCRLLFPILFFLLAASLFVACRSKDQNQNKTNQALIRIEDLLQDPNTEVDSFLRVTAANFDTYEGNGWQRNGKILHAINRRALLHFTNVRNMPLHSTLRFKARAANNINGVKIVSQGKELAQVALQNEWKEYAVKMRFDQLKPGRNRQLTFVFEGRKGNEKSFADFEYVDWPVYAWTKCKYAEESRHCLALNADASFRVTTAVPDGKPMLYFGIGTPGEALAPKQSLFEVSADGKQLFSKQIRFDAEVSFWTDQKIDLSSYAGKTTRLQFLSRTTAPEDREKLIAWSSPEIYDTSATREKWNVILFSIDTLRQDHVSYYGYPLPTTPHLDSLAKQSTVFQNAYCTFPGTLSSHASILTGLYVAHHQVATRDQPVPRVQQIADQFDTIAELAYRKNYTTAAITDGGYVAGFYGFDQGFQQYRENAIRRRDSVATIDNAIRWLDHNAKRPFLLFLHSYSVHEPFNPPIGTYRKLFPDDQISEPPKVTIDWLKEVLAGDIVPTEEQKKFVVRCYDAGVRYFDEQFGRFLQQLKNLGLDRNTVVIVFSDHGEQFFERGDKEFGHGRSLWPEEMRIPLIVYLPDGAAGNRSDLASTVDIYPTILDLLGIDDEQLKHDGVSLLKSPESPERKSRTIYYEVSYGDFALWGVQNHEYKLVLGADGTQLFFDIRKDPKERVNLVNTELRPMRIIKTALTGYVEKSNAPVRSAAGQIQVEEDAELREKLKALGYLN